MTMHITMQSLPSCCNTRCLLSVNEAWWLLLYMKVPWLESATPHTRAQHKTC